MNKEIKEILDDLLKCVNDNQQEQTLKTEHIKLLLDYITNLQQENERLNKTLEEHDETLENTFNLVGQLILRIDKAIEYIKTNGGTYHGELMYRAKDLLNILQGSEDNEC